MTFKRFAFATVIIAIYFVYRIGCDQSVDTYTIYRKTEEHYANLNFTLLKTSFWIIFVIWTFSASSPILYTFFQWPQPDKWMRPLESRWVPSHQVTSFLQPSCCELSINI